jgi:hypothetical protein
MHYTAQRSISMKADLTPLINCLALTLSAPSSLFSPSSGVTAAGWRKEILEDLGTWFIKVRDTFTAVLTALEE